MKKAGAGVFGVGGFSLDPKKIQGDDITKEVEKNGVENAKKGEEHKEEIKQKKNNIKDMKSEIDELSKNVNNNVAKIKDLAH